MNVELLLNPKTGEDYCGAEKSSIYGNKRLTNYWQKFWTIILSVCVQVICSEFIRLAQLGKNMQDQYGPKICHT